MGPTEISNWALSRIGVKNRIGNFNDESEEARLCSAFYNVVRDLTLSQYDWPFAQRREALAPTTASPSAEWAFRFAVPSDCVTPRRIESGMRQDTPESEIPFELESSDDGKTFTLLCDMEAPTLVYTTNLVAEGAWPSWFASLMAWNLAYELALPLSVTPGLRADAHDLAQRALINARGFAMKQHVPDRPPVSEFERARS